MRCSYGIMRTSSTRRSARRSNWALPQYVCLLTVGALSDEQILTRLKALPPNVGILMRCYTSPPSSTVLKALKARGGFISVATPDRATFATIASALRPHDIHPHIPRWQRARHRPSHAPSMSVHTVHEAIRAREAGARMVLVSPVFETSSHPDARVLGLFQARRLARMSAAPAYALGGITQHHVRRVHACGAFWGVAGISLFERDIKT